MRTALVNGSAFSSHARSRSSGADDTALGSDEDFEHGELLPGQRYVPAVPVYLAAERIQPQTCDLQHRRPVVRRAGGRVL